MRKLLFIGCLLFGIALCAMADDVRKPDSQIADNTFFDPTRKQKVEEPYQFGVEYRIEAGFAQHQQRTKNLTAPDMFLHGVRLGATFTFLLPLHFSMQTGLLYTLTYGVNEQHWRSMDAPSVQTEYQKHRVLEHNFTVPIRCYYTIPVWRDLNLLFYAGPQFQFCPNETDFVQNHLNDKTLEWLKTQNVPTETYDRLKYDVFWLNFQLGIGTGLEWQRYRVQGGYDFGLNNLMLNYRTNERHMWEWGWYVSFSYRL